MQRRLVVIRHAQAADGAPDIDRPLTEAGARQAAAIGTWLEQSGLVPGRVVVSPARRAAQTWQAVAARLDVAAITDERMYENTVEALLAIVRETPEDVGILALVGHNPSVGELVRALDDGQGNPSARDGSGAGFPTGAVAVFILAAPFDAIEPGAGTLTDLAVPAG
jgi:phosphohistidine phosphatase